MLSKTIGALAKDKTRPAKILENNYKTLLKVKKTKPK